MYICAIGTVGCGLVVFSSNDWIFFSLSLLTRFIQGFGNTLYVTSAFAIITNEFSDNQEKYLGWANGAMGIGLFLGPTVGAVLYTYIDYTYTFVTFGCLLVLTGLIGQLLLPSDLNTSSDMHEHVTASQAAR